MKALTYQGVGIIGYETVPDPAILAPGDAIVAVSLAAICGSDLHVYHGRELGMDAGTVMGHEFVGRVVETGADVAGLRVGERVMCPFTTSCGHCFYCAIGLTARCTAGQLFGWVAGGVGLHGGQAEYVRVPLADSTLLAVPDDIRPEEALLIGDVLATGYHCARMAEVGPRGTFVVLGCGPVGLMAVVAARALGAERLFAVDSVPERLEWAARFGAVPLRLAAASGVMGTVAAPSDATPSVIAQIRDATDGRGADAVLEAVGSPAAGRLAYDLVRPGGTIAVVGVHHAADFAFSPGEAYDKNLTVRVGRCPVRHHMSALVDLVRARQHELAAVFTHRRTLAEGAEAYALFDGKLDGCVKVLLEL
jgi:threonine dehydrogenase-like Zn-dependent dehydrogenase